MTHLISKLIPSVIVVGLVGFSFQSCQETEFANVQESTFHHDYETNFEKTFGKVDPNQTWDFSSYALHQRAMNGAATRAGEDYVSVASEDGYYHVESSTSSWININIPEGNDNRIQILRSEYRTEAESKIFEVVPIYQGQAGLVWSLNIHYQTDGEEAKDVELWTKGTNLQVYNYGRWSNVGTTGNTINASAIRSKPIKINMPAYTTFYFYLKITDASNASAYGHYGDILSSISDPAKIGVLHNLERPSNLPKGYSAEILACEDASTNRSDHDYNDVVFLLTGYVPEIIEHERIRNEYVKKRYLIEDLGNTYDFDFNDIVVDVTERTQRIWIISEDPNVDPYPKPDSPVNVEQWATVYYLCGTLPHQVKVGDTAFGQVTDPTDLEQTKEQLLKDPTILGVGSTCAPGSTPGIYPSITKIIEGNTWDPDKNNITVSIWKIASPSADPATTTGVWTSSFPISGEVPYMIAVNQSDEYIMPEGQCIDSEYFESGDTNYNPSLVVGDWEE